MSERPTSRVLTPLQEGSTASRLPTFMCKGVERCPRMRVWFCPGYNTKHLYIQKRAKHVRQDPPEHWSRPSETCNRYLMINRLQSINVQTVHVLNNKMLMNHCVAYGSKQRDATHEAGDTNEIQREE